LAASTRRRFAHKNAVDNTSWCPKASNNCEIEVNEHFLAAKSRQQICDTCLPLFDNQKARCVETARPIGVDGWGSLCYIDVAGKTWKIKTTEVEHENSMDQNECTSGGGDAHGHGSDILYRREEER
jgi:hypothetical protein